MEFPGTLPKIAFNLEHDAAFFGVGEIGYGMETVQVKNKAAAPPVVAEFHVIYFLKRNVQLPHTGFNETKHRVFDAVFYAKSVLINMRASVRFGKALIQRCKFKWNTYSRGHDFRKYASMRTIHIRGRNEHDFVLS